MLGVGLHACVGVFVCMLVMGVCVGTSSWRDGNMREVTSMLGQSEEPGLRAIFVFI